MLKQCITAIMLVLSVFSVVAGTLKEGVWQSSHCGVRQPPPTINATTVEQYNASVEAINSWQYTMKMYDDCLVQEANTDSALIAKTVQAEQATLKMIVDKINTNLESSRLMLEQNRSSVRF